MLYICKRVKVLVTCSFYRGNVYTICMLLCISSGSACSLSGVSLGCTYFQQACLTEMLVLVLFLMSIKRVPVLSQLSCWFHLPQYATKHYPQLVGICCSGSECIIQHVLALQGFRKSFQTASHLPLQALKFCIPAPWPLLETYLRRESLRLLALPLTCGLLGLPAS